MNKKLIDITEEEWHQYEWISTNNPSIFIRGIKYTSPPNDGYYYVEITAYGDEEQKWARARTYDYE